MAVYNNSVKNVDVKVSLVVGSWSAGDEANFVQNSDAYSTSTSIATDLAKLLIGPKFFGTFLSALTFICNRTSTGSVEIRGGQSDFTIGSVSTSDIHYDVFIKLVRNFLITYTTCTITKLRLWAGRVYLNTDCVATAIIMKAGDLTLSGAGSPPTTASLLQKSGTCTNNRIVTLGTIDGDATLVMDNTAGSFGNLYFNGKLFTWLAGDITTKIYAYTGIIDMSGLKAACTIADYEIGEGVKIILPPKNIMANPFTNSAKFLGSGPEIVASS